MNNKERTQRRSNRMITSKRESRIATIKNILSTREKSLDFLREAGILDQKGELSKLYK